MAPGDHLEAPFDQLANQVGPELPGRPGHQYALSPSAASVRTPVILIAVAGLTGWYHGRLARPLRTAPCSHPTRRRFLGTAAAATLPAWFLDECRAQPEPKAPTVKNDTPGHRPGRLRRAGPAGTWGTPPGSAGSSPCATWTTTTSPRPRRSGRRPPREHDFRKVMERKDVDVVVCGTVDHWHTLVSLAAMRAGKDVYCEKPLTLTIDEGKRLVEAQAKTKRILQTGSQQRSDKNFRLACELVRNGRLGKIKEVDVWLPAGPPRGAVQAGPGAQGLRLGPVAGPDAGRRVRAGADPRHLPLLVGLLRRDDDRLGGPPQRHRPVGPGPRPGRSRCPASRPSR